LISAFGEFGQRSRLPMLWVYAQNDHFFGPALAEKLRDAFVRGGGKVTFVQAPPFGTDGHGLFSSGGIPEWTPLVDDFLKVQNLVVRSDLLPPPTPPKIPPPPHLSANGNKAFTDFLIGGPHKAFAVAPTGSFGWTSGRRTVDAAKTSAINACPEKRDCRVVFVDDAPVK
jgi:hypothetical protein